MLSRVADALFWMSRYLERGEQIARLLDVCFHLELDLHGVLAGPAELHWTSLNAVLQSRIPESDGAISPQAAVSRWLTFDLANPDSIMSCVVRARANARCVRGTINTSMWRELNKLYWRLKDPDFARRAEDSPHEFYQAVESGSCLFQGVCDATLDHDEGWHFIQLGKYLERASKTLRIVDIQYHLLAELKDPTELPLANLQWGGVLRSCRAYDAYRRLYVGRVEPEKVVDLLLLHPTFPRSVRFCLESAAEALQGIEGESPGRSLTRADRELGLVLGELRYRDLDELLSGDLHTFLAGLQSGCTLVGSAMQQRYALR
jgi:uncharacterized alpha-E superfamily protein